MLHLAQLEAYWTTVYTNVDMVALLQLVLMLCINGDYFLEDPRSSR